MGFHLERAAGGDQFVLTRHGRPLATVGPPPGTPPQLQLVDAVG
jgi:antitoxin (DNA-binding transcriptional repressor) of toxin-antitoxin stability system